MTVTPDEPQVQPLNEEPPLDPLGQRSQRYDGEADPVLIIRANNAKRQYDQAGIEYPATVEDIDPAVALPPHLSQLDPVSAEVGGDDFELALIGNYFTPDSVIIFNGGEEPTTLENVDNPVRLTTIVKPSLVSMPISVPVLVRTGTHETKAINFAFVEPVIEEPPPEPEPEPEVLSVEPEGFLAPEGEPIVELNPEDLTTEEEPEEELRTFPIGPFSIRAIEDHEDGIAIMLFTPEGFEEGSIDVEEGDRVLVEATGNSSINGTYNVVTQDGTTVIVDNMVNLEAIIENKGRLTVVE